MKLKIIILACVGSCLTNQKRNSVGHYAVILSSNKVLLNLNFYLSKLKSVKKNLVETWLNLVFVVKSKLLILDKKNFNLHDT